MSVVRVDYDSLGGGIQLDPAYITQKWLYNNSTSTEQLDLTKDYIVVEVLRLQDSSDRCNVWKIEKGEVTSLHGADTYGFMTLDNNGLATFKGTNSTVPSNFVIIQLD